MISNTFAAPRNRRGQRKEAVCSHQVRQRGFTLVEVVVALAIVVVSFMALYGVMMQMVNATRLMQEKTIASWVAFDKVTELRLKADLSADPKSSGITEMAGTTWTYSVQVRSTGSDDIRQVIVTVAPENEPERTLGLVSGVIFSNVPVGEFPGPGPAADPAQGANPPVMSGASPDRGATQ
jgi:general secretion pathway protein I